MLVRVKKELQLFTTDPPDGISLWPVMDSLTHFEVEMMGPEDSPYVSGIFTLHVILPDLCVNRCVIFLNRYPIQPPQIKFSTPIYHPNIDNGGRICINALKMPPAGVWSPALNLATVLVNIRIMLSEPNPDDGLMEDITRQFRQNVNLYKKTAAEWTAQHAHRVVKPEKKENVAPPTFELQGKLHNLSNVEPNLLKKNDANVTSDSKVEVIAAPIKFKSLLPMKRKIQPPNIQ